MGLEHREGDKPASELWVSPGSAQAAGLVADSVSSTANCENTRLKKIGSVTLLFRLLFYECMRRPVPDTAQVAGPREERGLALGDAQLRYSTRQVTSAMDKVKRLHAYLRNKHAPMTYKVTTCMSKRDTGCLQPP